MTKVGEITGALCTLEKKEGLVDRKEYLYVHIQNRKFTHNISPFTDRFIICRDGFLDYEEDQIDLYFEKYGLNDNKDLQTAFEKKSIIKAKKSQKQKLIREVKKYPFRLIYNLFHRYDSIKYLKNNNLF